MVKGIIFITTGLFYASGVFGLHIAQNDSALVDTANVESIADTVAESSNAEILPTISQATNDLRFDTIIQKSGFAIVGSIKEKNLYEVIYIKRNEKLERKISTGNLKEIRYANGKIEIIDNMPEKAKKDWVPTVAEVEWKRVKIFTSQADVGNMNEIGEVEAFYEAKKFNVGNDILERNALIIMQKKAFVMEGKAILVILKDIKREYGEIPAITMKAKVYTD